MSLVTLILIGFLLNQGIEMANLKNRMERIESEEKDVDQIIEDYEEVFDSYQEIIEDIGDILEHQDLYISHISENQEVDREQLDEVTKIVDDIYDENKNLVGRLRAQQFQIISLWSNGTIQIAPELVEPRKTEFRIGETVTMNIELSYPVEGAIIQIWFPNGTLSWTSVQLTEWLYNDGLFISPYHTQVTKNNLMVLLEDYPQGNYTYSVSYLDLFNETGSFVVKEAWDEIISIGVSDLSTD